MVWVHGGGFQEGRRRDFPETLDGIDLPGALLAAGVAVASVDYRLSREAAFPAQLHDVKAAVRPANCAATGCFMTGRMTLTWPTCAPENAADDHGSAG